MDGTFRNMNYSKEQIFHFTCEKCDMWWSVAAENMHMDKKTWICSWCGYKHLPPHRDKNKIIKKEMQLGIWYDE